MSEVLANLAGTTMLSFAGYYVIKQIIKSQEKLNVKKILLLIFTATITVTLLKVKSTGIYTIVVILLNIITYKYIFNISIEESLLANSILWVNIFISDLSTAQFLCLFTTVDKITTTPSIILIANSCVSSLLVIIMNIKPLCKLYQKFYFNNRKGSKIINFIFLILLLIGFSLLAYKITISSSWSYDYIINTIIMLIFMVITFIYILNKNKYNQLTDEYDNLFSYIQNFEEWIEIEQFNRHEYKNQLAVLRYLTKEKKVKKKIDEILQDNIDLQGDVVSKLKYLPRGGIKGLMYYKSIIAKKNKIKLEVDVSLKDNTKLNKLSEQKIKDICRLIGVYFDNAIEAASKTKKKQILIEIYELKDKVKFVFSNTFNNELNIDRINEKGISTKGKGRGNGLYFANKLISKNSWLESKQKIVDKYYVQELYIKTKKNPN